jgi:hypothetical protein
MIPERKSSRTPKALLASTVRWAHDTDLWDGTLQFADYAAAIAS